MLNRTAAQIVGGSGRGSTAVTRSPSVISTWDVGLDMTALDPETCSQELIDQGLPRACLFAACERVASTSRSCVIMPGPRPFGCLWPAISGSIANPGPGGNPREGRGDLAGPGAHPGCDPKIRPRDVMRSRRKADRADDHLPPSANWQGGSMTGWP